MSKCCAKACNARQQQQQTAEPFIQLPPLVLAQLIELCQSGAAALDVVQSWQFSHPELHRLAELIARLAVDNNLLTRLLNKKPARPRQAPDEQLELAIDSTNNYSLFIPINTAKTRHELIPSLSSALCSLQTPSWAKNQKTLQFVEANDNE